MLNINTNFSAQQGGYKKQNNNATPSFKAQPHIDFVQDVFQRIAENPTKLKKNNLPKIYKDVTKGLAKMGITIQEGRTILLRRTEEVRTFINPDGKVMGHLKLTTHSPSPSTPNAKPFTTLTFDHKSPDAISELEFKPRHHSGKGSLRLSDPNKNPPKPNICRPESII